MGEFTWVADRIELPEVRKWCEECLGERGDLWSAVKIEPTGLLVRDGKRWDGGTTYLKKDDRKKEHDDYYGNGNGNGNEKANRH